MTSFGYRPQKALENSSVQASMNNIDLKQVLQLAGQSHLHEFLGSVRIAEAEEDPHNHRFAGVTSEVIPIGTTGDHQHGFFVNTDFYEEHHHEIAGLTGGMTPVGDGRHVHFAEVVTTFDDGHFHEGIFATLIQDPIGE